MIERKSTLPCVSVNKEKCKENFYCSMFFTFSSFDSPMEHKNDACCDKHSIPLL